VDLQDFRYTTETRLDCDVCIVGSGPAGLAIAQELSASACKVLLIESGDVRQSAEVTALDRVENVGAPRVPDSSRVRSRGFGGTSNVWNGRCVPLSPLDLAERSWVPLSGWPLTHAQLQPYFARAARYLGLWPVDYDAALEASLPVGLPPLSESLARDLARCCWQFSVDEANPSVPTQSAGALLARGAGHGNLQVLLQATATHIEVDGNAQLQWLEIRSLTGRSARVHCKQLVLCAGGIETPRLLLSSRSTMPTGLGNQHDMLGRCFMDHPRCAVGHFDLGAGPQLRPPFMLQRVDAEGRPRYFIRGLALTPDCQQREQLLNCAGWIDARVAPDDPWDAIKRLARRQSQTRFADAYSIVSQPRLTAAELYRRFVERRPVLYKTDALTLFCDVEQMPNLDSRLGLSEERDVLGVPLARIDWRFGHAEQRTVQRFGQLAKRAFVSMGLPELRLTECVRTGAFQPGDFMDVAHPAGATRMASDPRRGVVDEQGQVHGVSGVFVAGTSVFPTLGHANPTLTLMALALRLADHIKARHLARAVPLSAEPIDLSPVTQL
jgi:choline dehydrogenase-like flavoprotein